jgi:hypothetical protein
MKIPLPALTLAMCAFAQSPTEPTPFLQLTRIPNGSKAVRPYQRIKAAIDVLGMTSMTGLPENWLVEGHVNFASIEDLDSALRTAGAAGPADQFGQPQPDELLGGPRTIIASYQPKFSYRPGEASRNLAKSRYFSISIYRSKPDSDAMLVIAAARRSSFDSANLDRPELTYRVISGAPAETYLVLAPLTSLRQIDQAMLSLPSYAEPVTLRTSVNFDSEHLLFRVDPRLSYVSPEFAGSDSAFWNPQRQ